jgi:hypothetical protein
MSNKKQRIFIEAGQEFVINGGIFVWEYQASDGYPNNQISLRQIGLIESKITSVTVNKPKKKKK